MVILLPLLIALTQPLPAELQTVTLRIAEVHDAHGSVYVVTSAHFDARQPARVQTYRHSGKRSPIQGAHMERVAALLARDPQCVFVLAEAHARLATKDALARAGIVSIPLLADR